MNNIEETHETQHSCCSHEHHAPISDISTVTSESGKYYCPMLCEGDKKYDKPGHCPVCGMDLVKEKTAGRDEGPEENIAYKKMLKHFWVALGFTLPIFIISMGDMVGIPFHALASMTTWGWVQLALSIPVIFYATGDFFIRGWKSVTNKSPNMWTLISLGAGAAFLFSIVGLLFPGVFPSEFKMDGAVHLYFEAATVILTLILLGQVLELRAHGQTNAAIRELLNLVPPEATVIRNGHEQTIPLEEVQVNDILKIKPGEKVPVDGEITTGHSSVDESMVSGEPMAVGKQSGDEVIGGTVNKTGSFEMKALKVGSDTLLAQIVEMVNQASRSKAPIQNLADKIARYFVPVVVSISLISFVAWAVWGPEPALIYAFTNAVAVLIVACPCALGLATPMSIMVGTGQGAKMGILIKEARVIEAMEKVDVLLIDKTGTITEGKPVLKSITPFEGYTEDEILAKAAALEKESEHPIAQAIVEGAKGKGLTLQKVTNFDSVTGQGIKGQVNGKTVAAGNKKLLEGMEIDIHKEVSEAITALQEKAETVVYVIIDGQVVGLVSVADPVKATSAKAIKSLQEQGLKVIMLTGDNMQTAKAVAEETGLDGYEVELLPQDKQEKVKALQAQGKVVAMAGDGINDAPALAQADVGIAMGTGTDAAIESAGITLVKGDLSGILKAVKLSKAVMKNIRQNLFFAFIYNTIGLPIAAGLLFPLFGLLLSPMLAALAMSLSSVSVIGNALRLKSYKL